MAGIDFISVVVGLFAIPEILANLEAAAAKVYQTRLAGIYPTLQDWRRCIGAFIRGTLIGFFVGILPGNGLAIASFIAYDVEKKSSRQPEKFGTGMIEGVAVS
ncbi:MAG: tripartite tricarboxylate transporter permease, partial [Candidatus Methylomirabilales bacterium]